MVNAAFFGYSGNDIHAFMDKAAKTARQKHREVWGHDSKALIMMLSIFQPKYTQKQIMETFYLHIWLDSIYSGVQESVRQHNKGYGKKPAVLSGVNKILREIERYERF